MRGGGVSVVCGGAPASHRPVLRRLQPSGNLLPSILVILAMAAGAVLAAVPAPAAATPAVVRDLTFRDRVAAQRAIDRLEYQHRIGTRRPFEEAVPEEITERRVLESLRRSAALENVWRTRVSRAMLDAELRRMARRTWFPDRLRAVEEALGGDPLLLRECLARPVLVERLVQGFFEGDRRIHAGARESAGRLRADLARGRIDPRHEREGRTVVEVSAADAASPDAATDPGIASHSGIASHRGDPSGGRRDAAMLRLGREQFAVWRAGLPAGPGEVGPVVEERDAFAIHVILEERATSVRVATYVVPKTGWDEWWAVVAPALDPFAVKNAPGEDALPAPEIDTTGACPGDDVWNNGSLDDPFDPRQGHSAVWTGSEFIVWGGFNGRYMSDGARYDPLTDSWTRLSAAGAPAARYWHSGLWTGARMLVWGGNNGSALNSGGLYDPGTDTWSPTNAVAAPPGRYLHTAVWTGEEMLVWGGRAAGGTNLGGGAAYDPDTGGWRPMTTAGAPVGRYSRDRKSVV